MHVVIPGRGELPQMGGLKVPKKLSSALKLFSYDGEVMSLVAERRMHRLSINQGCSERDGIDTLSSGSKST